MALSEKRRVTAIDKLKVKQSVVDVRGPYVKQSSEEDLWIYSSQITRSEGHAWPQGRGKWDNGGPFDTIKLQYRRAPRDTAVWNQMYFYDEYKHTSDTIPFSAWIHNPFLSPYTTTFDQYAEFVSPASGRTNLTTLGTRMISQTIPTNPVVDGSVALAELVREGLPSMIGTAFLKNRADFFRSLGSEYLNIEFGWKPLVSDVRNAAKAIIESETIMKNLVKHSGRDLRRQRLLPLERSISQVYEQVGGINPSWMSTSAFSRPPVYRQWDVTTRQQSFSGSYLYHIELEKLSEVSKIATQARLLYGLELSPEVLWNLAPWSWLVDWFANVGPLLSNVSAFQNDGLVLRYGYVMEHVTRTVHRSNTVVPNPGVTHPLYVSDALHGEWKRREKATPFGFGLNSTSFTNRQWSILGALGLTRIPKVL